MHFARSSRGEREKTLLLYSKIRDETGEREGEKETAI